MNEQLFTHPKNCPACGIELESENHITACPACGASLIEDLPVLPEQQRLELEALIFASNEKLFKRGADSAEQSFGLGCLLIAAPFVVISVALTLLDVFNLIMLVIALVMSAMLVAILTTTLAFYARKRAADGLYRQEVAPEIEKRLLALGVPAAVFDRYVHELLPEDAPLRVLRALPPLEATTPL